MRQAAISLLTPPGRNLLLLGRNNQGRHRGRIIPPSETVESWETPYDAACRGIREEVEGIRVSALRRVGLIEVVFEERKKWNIRLHVFRGEITEGTPRPRRNGEFSWFRFYRFENIPVDMMWPSTRFWIHQVLKMGLDDPEFGRRILLPRSPRHVVSRLTSLPSCLEAVNVAS